MLSVLDLRKMKVLAKHQSRQKVHEVAMAATNTHVYAAAESGVVEVSDARAGVGSAPGQRCGSTLTARRALRRCSPFRSSSTRRPCRATSRA